MPDNFTTTSTQGFFSRLAGSFAGLLFGPLLVLAAIILLSWNEGRAVHAIRGLTEVSGAVMESPADTASPANEGKLVHVVGPVQAGAPIQDDDLALSFANQVAVNRTVEIYAWTEKKDEKTQDNTGGSQTTTTTYSYSRDWTDAPADSSKFAHPAGHENPPLPFASHKYAASDAHLGAFALDAATLGLIDAPDPMTPAAPGGWTQSGGNLYRSQNPSAPSIGDLRVHYTSLGNGATVSVLAAQSHGGFAPYTASNGYTVELARAGNAPAGDMIQKQQQAESVLTWILRIVGAVVMFAGFAMFFGPIATLASILPFLGSLVRGASAAFAFVLTIPVTLVTIAIAWLAFRPLIGGGILLLAAALGYGLWRWHSGRAASRAAATAR